MNQFPKKVLLLSPLPPPVGGIAKWSVNLLSYINDIGYDNFVHLNTALKKRSITDYSFIRRLYYGFFHSFTIIYKYIKIIVKQKPKVVHATTSASFGLFRDLILVFIALIFKIKFILHFRFGRIPDLSVKRNWEWLLIKLLSILSTEVIVIDLKSFNTLIAFGYKNIHLIPNPCSADVEVIAKSTDKKDRTIDLLYVGHLLITKGVFEMVEAISKIEEEIDLYVVGPYENEVKRRMIEISRKKNNGTWLKIIGEKKGKDIYDLMQKSKILLLPSYTEGFPTVLIEAMACGCPVISTNVGAIPEMLGVNTSTPAGICIEPKDIEALKSKIELLFSNNELRNDMGLNGKSIVLSKYSMLQIYDAYFKLWMK